MHVKLDSQVKVNNHHEPVRASNNGVGFGYGYGANSLDEANDEVGEAIAAAVANIESADEEYTDSLMEIAR